MEPLPAPPPTEEELLHKCPHVPASWQAFESPEYNPLAIQQPHSNSTASPSRAQQRQMSGPICSPWDIASHLSTSETLVLRKISLRNEGTHKRTTLLKMHSDTAHNVCRQRHTSAHIHAWMHLQQATFTEQNPASFSAYLQPQFIQTIFRKFSPLFYDVNKMLPIWR